MSAPVEKAKSPPALPQVMTLPALQKHIHEMCEYFDWYESSNERTFLMFTEEVGELAKAIRKSMRIAEEAGTEQTPEAIKANLAEEFADCFNYLADLANRFDIDLEKAYADKAARNLTRVWNRSGQ